MIEEANMIKQKERNYDSMLLKVAKKYFELRDSKVIEAFNLRKTIGGTKSYIDEHNPDFSITLKQIRLILEQNNIETNKRGKNE